MNNLIDDLPWVKTSIVEVSPPDRPRRIPLQRVEPWPECEVTEVAEPTLVPSRK